MLSVERIKGIEAGTGGGRPSSSQPQSQSIAASLTRKQRQRHTKKDDSAVLGALKRNQTSKWTQEGGRVATNPPASLTEASAIRAGTTSDLPADWQPIEIESKQTEQHTQKKEQRERWTDGTTTAIDSQFQDEKWPSSSRAKLATGELDEKHGGWWRWVGSGRASFRPTWRESKEVAE